MNNRIDLDDRSRMDRFLSFSPDLHCTLGFDTTVLWANDAFRKVFGDSARDLSGISFSQLLHGDDVVFVLSELKALAGGRPAGSFIARCKNGSALTSPVDWHVTADLNEELLYVSGRAMALNNAQDRDVEESFCVLSATIESTGNGILLLDNQGKIISSNQQFCKLLAIENTAFHAAAPDEQRKMIAAQTNAPGQFWDRVEKSILDSEQEECTDVITLADGRFMERSIRPQWIARRRVGTLLGFRDVTESHCAAASLAETSNLLDTMLDNSPDYIYFKDLQSRFVRYSKSMLSLLNLTDANALKGKTDFDFFLKEHAQPAFDDEQEIIRTGIPIIGKCEKETHPDGRVTWALTTKVPWRDKNGKIIGTFGISKNITASKETETQLEQANMRVVETSRLAGMAEVATSVLHNVGNVLNSVNVSSAMLKEHLHNSKLPGLKKAVSLMAEHSGDIGDFLTKDVRGRQLPIFLGELASELANERGLMAQEITSLEKNIAHIKEIVAMQQSYAKVAGVVEKIKLSDLIEDSLRINAGALVRHEVQVVREYTTDLPEITVEKHKVLQILVNLIRNAKYACDESNNPHDKKLTVAASATTDRVTIMVVDNGVGIPKENLNKIFNHGFTTRKHGHGFGLHSGALSASELGGSLSVQSDGLGKGATFILELPIVPGPKDKPRRISAE